METPANTMCEAKCPECGTGACDMEKGHEDEHTCGSCGGKWK